MELVFLLRFFVFVLFFASNSLSTPRDKLVLLFLSDSFFFLERTISFNTKKRGYRLLFIGAHIWGSVENVEWFGYSEKRLTGTYFVVL